MRYYNLRCNSVVHLLSCIKRASAQPRNRCSISKKYLVSNEIHNLFLYLFNETIIGMKCKTLLPFPRYQPFSLGDPSPWAQKQLLTSLGHVRIHLSLASGLFCIIISYLLHVSLYIFAEVSAGSVLKVC